MNQWCNLAHHRKQVFTRRLILIAFFVVVLLLLGVVNVAWEDGVFICLIVYLASLMPLYVSIENISNHMFIDINEKRAAFHLVDVFNIGKHRNALATELTKSIEYLVSESDVKKFIVETPSYIDSLGTPRNHIILLTTDCMKKAGAKEIHVTVRKLSVFSPIRWVMYVKCWLKGRDYVNKKNVSVIVGYF